MSPSSFLLPAGLFVLLLSVRVCVLRCVCVRVLLWVLFALGCVGVLLVPFFFPLRTVTFGTFCTVYYLPVSTEPALWEVLTLVLTGGFGTVARRGVLGPVCPNSSFA